MAIKLAEVDTYTTQSLMKLLHMYVGQHFLARHCSYRWWTVLFCEADELQSAVISSSDLVFKFAEVREQSIIYTQTMALT